MWNSSNSRWWWRRRYILLPCRLRYFVMWCDDDDDNDQRQSERNPSIVRCLYWLQVQSNCGNWWHTAGNWFLWISNEAFFGFLTKKKTNFIWVQECLWTFLFKERKRKDFQESNHQSRPCWCVINEVKVWCIENVKVGCASGRKVKWKERKCTEKKNEL